MHLIRNLWLSSARTASADELYNSQREVDAMLGSLDAQVDTLEKLKRGEIPVAPAAAAAVIVPEPEVTTVTVRKFIPVPDIPD